MSTGTGDTTEPAVETALLSVEGLGTGYGDLRVVWDVSFEVRAGEITVLLGRNGAGKTTTMRALTGLNDVAAGRITLNGTEITTRAPHERVSLGMAYVQEGKRVFRAQTIEQNLLLGGYTRKLGRAGLRSEVERIYDFFPILGEKRGLPASSLSGGQQQMLAIGQALMAQPTLLLLDEPSGGLAPVIVREVMERVDRLKEAGLGILLVEQSVDVAFGIADHVTVIGMGRNVLSLPAAEVADVGVLRDAYFGRLAGRDD